MQPNTRYAGQPGGAPVAAAQAEQIACLNLAGKINFKEALWLRVGGMDQYSRWHLPELVTAVGAAGMALIDASFPGQPAEAQKRAGDGAAVDGAGAGGAAGHSEGAGRNGGCRQTGDRTRRRERFGRASANVRKRWPGDHLAALAGA